MEPIIETEFTSREEIKSFLKIVLVGDSNVGKTSLLHALSRNNETGRGYSVSLEFPFGTKRKRELLIGRIYDLRSQRYFPYLHSLYYNNAKGAIVVFDVTNRKSFESIRKWRSIIWGHTGNIPILICGNKSDLKEDDRSHVSIEEAKQLSKEFSKDQSIQSPYIEISASKRIIAYSNNEINDQPIEDIYPTIDAFRAPFVSWLLEIAKCHKIQ
ncbi:MAG TPA: GTP-binding protein [candidate division Zixibacteria bacterium]|nr:GTP-binding protein [candidate division Zixibacteria bacterium]